MKDPPTPLAYFPIDDYEPEIKYSVSLFFNRCLSNINLEIYSMINIIMMISNIVVLLCIIALFLAIEIFPFKCRALYSCVRTHY